MVKALEHCLQFANSLKFQGKLNENDGYAYRKGSNRQPSQHHHNKISIQNNRSISQLLSVIFTFI